MAGGTFTSQNKVRPGAYINTEGSLAITSVDTDTGVVILPLESLSWGPVGVSIPVDASTRFLQSFGRPIDSAELMLLREVLKNASQVKVVRMNSGTKAKADASDYLKAEALYPGTTGNDITLKMFVQPSGTVNRLTLETYLSYPTPEGGTMNTLAYSQSVTMQKGPGEGEDAEDVDIYPDASEFSDNPYVAINLLAGGFTDQVTVALEGGTNIAPTPTQYEALNNILSTEEFNYLAWTGTSSPLAVVTLIQSLRENEGKKVQIVVPDPVSPTGNGSTSFDYEGVIKVPNGVRLEDGTELSPYEATAWVAGANAGAGVASSITYKDYQGSTEAIPKYSNDKTIELLQLGYTLFTDKRGVAVVEQDLNSLVTLTSGKSPVFKKNRVMRTLDAIANNSKQAFEDNYIGKVPNTLDGRELFKADRINYFDGLQGAGAIQNFTPEDIEVTAGEQIEGVVLNVNIQPIDAMEKLYMSVKVL